MSDEELVQQIKSVFDNYDDGLGEQGWDELRKKYPEKESKKLPIWWLTGIAATLLVVVGLYFSNAFDTEKVILTAGTFQNKSILPENTIHNKDKSASIAKLDTVTSKIYEVTQSDIEKIEKPDPVSKTKLYIAQDNFANNTKATKEISTVVSNSNIEQTKPLILPDDNNSVIAAKKTDEKIIENAGAVNHIDVAGQPSKPKLSTEDFLKEQSKILANNKSKNTEKNSSSKTTL
ncbi:MAG: hypothetical protein EOO96_11225, partial [Pedobacter sp.]